MDELIPDLAPNLYSQGKIGTGYAQVFDTGAPNPFDVYSDYIKKSVENEQKRQEKLDEFLASVDDIDQPWNVAKDELGKKINDYGDLIATKRAVGTPINSAELTKAQKELKDLAKVNESNYQKAMKIGTEMQDPLIYTKEESDAFQKEIKDATLDANGNPKEGGIYEVQKVLDKWQKGVETPNVIQDYKKIKPVAKSDKTGYRKETSEEDFNNTVKAQLTNYQKPQLKKLLKMYQDENRIGVANFTPQDIDDNNQDVLDAIEVEMREDLKGQKELDITPKTSSGSRGGGYYSSNKKETGFNPKPFRPKGFFGSNDNDASAMDLGNTKGVQYEFDLADGTTVVAQPVTIGYGKVTSRGSTLEGAMLTVKLVAGRGAKSYRTPQEAEEDGVLVADLQQDPNTGEYYTIQQPRTEYVPLNSRNVAALNTLDESIIPKWKKAYKRAGGNEAFFDEQFSKMDAIDMN